MARQLGYTAFTVTFHTPKGDHAITLDGVDIRELARQPELADLLAYANELWLVQGDPK